LTLRSCVKTLNREQTQISEYATARSQRMENLERSLGQVQVDRQKRDKTEWKYAGIRLPKVGWWLANARNFLLTRVLSNGRPSTNNTRFSPVRAKDRGKCGSCPIPTPFIALKASLAACRMACTIEWARRAPTKLSSKLRITTNGFRN